MRWLELLFVVNKYRKLVNPRWQLGDQRERARVLLAPRGTKHNSCELQ